ncbi:hypothetical protein CRENBAI_012474 [Crenichthys baileyi]|uniref:Uncharacterized protein n=1 Tax=Crenichthys baileyi TaxID=28760 RepID=A0AAV9RFL5_9TELE
MFSEKTSLPQAPLLHPTTDHTTCCDGKTRAPHNAIPASAHKHKKADTTKPHTQNGPPNPTPRWVQLTWQAIPGHLHAPGADGPHHAPTTTQRNHINITATTAQGETTISSAPLSPLS